MIRLIYEPATDGHRSRFLWDALDALRDIACREDTPGEVIEAITRARKTVAEHQLHTDYAGIIWKAQLVHGGT